MNKRLKLLLAIVSIVLSMVMVLGLCACKGGETTVRRKKKKVVIVKKPSSSQTDDTSSEEETEEDDYEYEEEEEEEVVEEEKPKSLYEVDLEEKVFNPLNEQMGMAFYHFYQGEWDNLLADTFGTKEAEFLTYYRIKDIADLRALKEKNGLGWWLIGNPFPNRNTTEFRDGWTDSILRQAKAYKDAGVWDQLAGFETEEICMAVTQEQFKTLTRWLRDNFPEKRIFACLSMYEVRGTAPAGFTIAPMSYDTYGYITDIGYDWYSHLDEKQYRDAVELMLSNMGRRNNVRVWFFPTSYKFSTATDEAFVTTHLNMMYDILLDQKNPGGLYLYTWVDYPTGIASLLDPNLGYQWNNWGRRIIEIGKEMRASSYRYDYSLYN